MGAKLMPLVGHAADVVGVEPIEAYVQLGALFREREGLAPLDTRIGSAEDPPLSTGRYDLIFCIRAHVYFDVRPAIAQLARALAPGGELVLIARTFGQFLKGAAQSGGLRPANLPYTAVAIANTISYSVRARRLFSARGALATSRPVYASARRTLHWLKAAGLDIDRSTIQSSDVTCLTGDKP